MAFNYMRCRLIVEHGAFASIGVLDKMIRIEAVGVEVAEWTQTILVELIERRADGTFVETRSKPSLATIQALESELRALGEPALNVAEAPLEPVADTGDGWERITLLTDLDDGTRAWSMTMQWSGFRGTDADRWRALFASILELAGVREHHHAWART